MSHAQHKRVLDWIDKAAKTHEVHRIRGQPESTRGHHQIRNLRFCFVDDLGSANHCARKLAITRPACLLPDCLPWLNADLGGGCTSAGTTPSHVQGPPAVSTRSTLIIDLSSIARSLNERICRTQRCHKRMAMATCRCLEGPAQGLCSTSGTGRC